MKENAKFLCVGALAGLANGFFGSGGGLFLVPLMIGWLGVPEKSAFATSVAIILSLSAVSVWIYQSKGGMDWTLAWPYLLGGSVGGILAGPLFRKASLRFLHGIFGILLLYGGVKAVMGW